jgi:hypothetical protein
VNLVKCKFNIERIEFLGFIISSDNIEIKTSRVIAIRKWLASKNNIREVQVFLDFINFYRKFIYKYFKIVKELTNLLKTSKKLLY